MISPAGDYIVVFDLESKVFQSNFSYIPINTKNGPSAQYGCLASSDRFLVLTEGGWNGMIIFQVLDLNDMMWLSNVPSLQQSRRSHACTVHPLTNKLYVIGGVYHSDSYIYLESIEI